jgi:hypothetical protein
VAVAVELVAVLSALAGWGATCCPFRVAWKRGCIEFELTSLAIAGIAASRAGKFAWVEVDELTTVSFVVAASRVAGGSVNVERVVERRKGR